MKSRKLLLAVAAVAVLLLGLLEGSASAHPPYLMSWNALGPPSVGTLPARKNADTAVSSAREPGYAPIASSLTLLADADTTLKSGFPNGNFGGAETLDLQYAYGGRTVERILLHFNLSAVLPSGATIDSAQLQVRLNSGRA